MAILGRETYNAFAGRAAMTNPNGPSREETECWQQELESGVNNDFWDRSPEERAQIMERACEQGGVSNFFDLSPEERGRAYD